MRKALTYVAIGGILAAVGLYLFPMSVGQELFINYLGDTSGQGYWYGVFLAMLIAGLLIVTGFFLVRPGFMASMKNPIVLAGVLLLVLLTVVYLIPFITGLLGGV